MKKILLLTIVFHSFCYLANAMVVDSTNELSDEQTLGWLEDLLGKETAGKLNKQDPLRRKAFLDLWWKAVRDLTLNKSLSAQRQSLIWLVDEVLKENTETEAFDAVFQIVTKKILEKTIDIPRDNNDLEFRKSQAAVAFHKTLLASLIREKKFDGATENEIKFYLEILNDVDAKKKIVKKLQKKYFYLGRFRTFKEPFMEINFLKHKDTNEIIATKNYIAIEPNSIKFCIAEILRNEFYRSKSKGGLKIDQATANPLSIPGQFFKDYDDADYLEVSEKILLELKKYIRLAKTKYRDDEIKKMIEEAKSQKMIEEAKSNEREHLIADPADKKNLSALKESCIALIDHHVDQKLYSPAIGEQLKAASLHPVVLILGQETACPRYFIERLVHFGEKKIDRNDPSIVLHNFYITLFGADSYFR